jgi:hypothetical protein
MSRIVAQIIRWRKWTEACKPPVDRAFLAWMGRAADPWCVVLRAMDDEGFYFAIDGTGETADPSEASHWAEIPKGPHA